MDMTQSDLFLGTADYYARFRPAYPAEFLDELLRRTVSGGLMLVDLGCGTGEVAIPLSPHFDDVLAVDVDPDMIERGGVKRWVTSRAEDVELPGCELIIAGASFHWMDRETLAPRCFAALANGGAIAVLGTNSTPWEATHPWHETVIAVIRRHVGELRRAGGQIYSVEKKHEDFLKPAGFRIEEFNVEVEKTWTIGTYLGFLYSTSFAGHHVLGDRKDAFERDMRRAFGDVSVDRTLTETLRFYAVLGHKD